MRVVLLLCFIAFATACFAQEEGALQTINGTKLFVRTIGQGEPVIVVHGGPGLSHDYFLPHLKGLGKRFKVVLYDQRASGRSLTPASDSVSLRFLVDDLEAIRKSLSAEKVTILAHSWGAILAVNYAYQHQHRVKRLILCNPVPLSKEYDADMQRAQQSRFTSKDSTDRSIIIGSPAFKAGKSSAYQNLLRYTFRHSFYDARNLDLLQLVVPENYTMASRALYTGLGKDLQRYDYFDYLKSFDFKVLVIQGLSDVVPSVAMTRMHELAPQSTLLFYNKSGHFAFIEQNKKFLTDVTDFIRE